jgi:hypothetical protein
MISDCCGRLPIMAVGRIKNGGKSINGEACAMTPAPSLKHQDTVSNFNVRLQTAAYRKGD